MQYILQELQIFFERIIPNDGAGERTFSLAAHSAVHLIEPLEVWVFWVSLQESNHSPSPSSQRAARDIWIRMLLRGRGVNELWNTCSTQTRMPGRPRKYGKRDCQASKDFAKHVAEGDADCCCRNQTFAR